MGLETDNSLRVCVLTWAATDLAWEGAATTQGVGLPA